MARSSALALALALSACTAGAPAGHGPDADSVVGPGDVVATDAPPGADAQDAALDPIDVNLDASKPDAAPDAAPDAEADAHDAAVDAGAEDASDAADTAADTGADVSDAKSPDADASPADTGAQDAETSDAADPDVPAPIDVAPVDAVPHVSDATTSDAEDAAAGDADAEDVDAGPPFEYPWQPAGTCDQPAYEWLPPSEVGALLSYAEQPFYTLTPELITMLLKDLGYPGELPIAYGTRVYKIRYVTQDRGQLREATAMVGVPDMTATATEPAAFPSVLFMHPTVGYADACAPSDGLTGAAAAVLPASVGFVSIAPDLLGMCGKAEPCGGFHPYLIGEPTAVAALDAVRATDQLLAELAGTLKVVPDGRVVPWGASQGGHAALFVDRYAPVYAPEIDISCVVAIVPPSDLAGQAGHALATLDGSTSLGTAFVAAALLWYEPAGGAAQIFNENGPLNYAEHIPATFPTTCSDKALVQGASVLEDVFTEPFITAMKTGDLAPIHPWGCMTLENSLPSTTVPLLSDSEVLFVLGTNDELVDHETERAAFETLCTQGYRMEMIDCLGAGHADAAVDTLPQQIAWVQGCLAGDPIPEELECVPVEPASCK